MDSYIVRIYRRSGEDPESIAGMVEDVGRNEKKGFANLRELVKILNVKGRTDLTRVSGKIGAKRNNLGKGR